MFTARRGKAIWLLVLVLVASMATPVRAQEAAWRAEYYNNIWLSGTPVLVRDDPAINFDWGGRSPGNGVDSDHFSVRWTRSVSFEGGRYRFYVTCDDGARLWIDGQLVIDQWHDHPVTTYTAELTLYGGVHHLRMEYYENMGMAVAKLWWERTDGMPISGWRGEYYGNPWLSGAPTLVRQDAEVNFDWGGGSPDPAIPPDNFSVRWTRDVYFETTGHYTFSTTTDDGVRLWVDGRLIIDQWKDQPATTHTATIYLTQGTHPVRMEYYEHLGNALARLSWQYVTPPPPPEEIVVDDLSPGFIKGGPYVGWHSAYTGYAGHMWWTQNSTYAVYNWALWKPSLPGPGRYEVYVYIPHYYTTTGRARYRIFHAGQRHDRWVNQNAYSNQWVSLGTYYFNARGSEFVYLSDNTHEPYLSRLIGFDAVKFVSREPPPPPTPVCSITPVLGFGRIWNRYPKVRERLGCPTEPERGVPSAEEPFERGYMFWRSDLRHIYVLYDGGTWQGFVDTWEPGQPEYDPGIVPPAGYYQPVRGFGKVWREQPGVRERLGWATAPERSFTASVQPFERGWMLWSDLRGIYVLYSDGAWEHYW